MKKTKKFLLRRIRDDNWEKISDIERSILTKLNIPVDKLSGRQGIKNDLLHSSLLQLEKDIMNSDTEITKDGIIFKIRRKKLPK